MKEKLLRAGSYVLVAVLATLLTLVLVDHEVGLQPSKLDQLDEMISERFVGEADMEALADAAAEAMVDATGDRWSYYIAADEYASYEEQKANAYVGVGITIQKTGENEGFLITDVTTGGPAQEADLQVMDLLVEVEGQDIRQMNASEVRDLVRGEEGTYVLLTIMRQGEYRTISVERRTVQTPVATGEMLNDSIGLVTIVNFDSRCADETIAAIETLLEQGAQKLIFDVRYNPGGFASELVKVLDYLLPEGELFRTVRYDGMEQVDLSDADCLEIPMAVLINSGSYSAAEFFAAALSEYDAAVIVGEQTVGKGYFQTTYTLCDGSAVVLSIGEYFTPKGANLAGVGVIPDVKVPVDEETTTAIYYGTLEAKDDPQIQAAIKVLK